MQRQAPISTRGQPSAVGAGLCNPPHPGRAGSRRAHRTPGRRLPHRLRRRLCDAEGADAFGGRGAAARCALPGRCGVAAGEPWIPVPLSRRPGQRAAGGVRCLSEEGTRGRGSMCSGGWVGRGDIWCFFCGCQPCGPASSRRRHGPEAKWHEGVVHLATASACSGLHMQTPTCVSPPHARAGTHSTHTADTSGGGGVGIFLFVVKGWSPGGYQWLLQTADGHPPPPAAPPLCARGSQFRLRGRK